MMIVNILGLILIVLIVWWFWLYKGPAATGGDGAITVIVENGTYQPSRIKLTAGKPTTLQFLRKDASPCAEMVLVPKLDVSETLPLNKVKAITLPALAGGEYDFHCQMQMYRGVLQVE